MKYINEVEIIGRVGSFRQEAGMSTFSVCTNTVRKDADGSPVVESTWLTIISPGDIPPLEKGDPVHVTGRIASRNYTSSDGVIHSSHHIVADLVEKVNAG